jgi:hypothetical protein
LTDDGRKTSIRAAFDFPALPDQERNKQKENAVERQSDNGLLNGLSRRHFLKKAGSGAAIAGLSGHAATSTFAQQLQVPDPPGKKLGWAIVGLGRLSINQILPAFAKCEKSKVVAFVTGSREKGEKLAARYSVNPKNIYNYQNYDSLRDNPEVDIIYIVLPNGMHAEYTIRAAKAGKHVLCERSRRVEKPIAN